jgi:hypothetical protein
MIETCQISKKNFKLKNFFSWVFANILERSEALQLFIKLWDNLFLQNLSLIEVWLSWKSKVGQKLYRARVWIEIKYFIKEYQCIQSDYFQMLKSVFIRNKLSLTSTIDDISFQIQNFLNIF